MTAIILNIALFVLGTIGCVRELRREGVAICRYYTFDSNVLGMMAGGLMSVSLVFQMIMGGDPPLWVITLKFSAAVCLSLTFLVVVFVLCPMEGGYVGGLFSGNLIYQHTLCPILAVVSFLAFDPFPTKSLNLVFLAWIPTAVYAIVIVILNIKKVLEGPYPFLYVYRQPWYISLAWALGIVGSNLAFAFLMYWIKIHIGS